MTIKIMKTTSLNRKILQHIRNIVVDNNEVYKIVFSNGNSNYSQKEVSINRNNLIYGKGKINFKINQVKDGSGILLPDTNYSYVKNFWKDMIPESIYCFYKEGLFTAEKSKYYSNIITWSQYKYGFNDFEKQIKIFINEHEKNSSAMPKDIIFKGWYLNPKGTGTKIDSIEKVYDALFINQNESTNIPEITLYACWELPMRTITLRNIRRTCFKTKAVGYSLFKYDGKTIKGNAKKYEDRQKIIKVLYNTPRSVILKKISGVKYHTWAKAELDGTSYEKKLRNNYLQSFLGWYPANIARPSGKVWYCPRFDDPGRTSSGIKENITIYPQFETLIILKHSKLPAGTVFRSYDNSREISVPSSGVGGNYVLLFSEDFEKKYKKTFGSVFGFYDYEFEELNDSRASGAYFVNTFSLAGILPSSYSSQYYKNERVVYEGNSTHPTILLDAYAWNIDKYDTARPPTSSSWTNEEDNIPYSMTIVYTIKEYKNQRY